MNNQDNIKKLGWIGTGVMGKSMCKHLINSGYELMILCNFKIYFIINISKKA
jgi:3-hydroxyacyl-CoA dehydrogenase